jgi:hypothetical protein
MEGDKEQELAAHPQPRATVKRGGKCPSPSGTALPSTQQSPGHLGRADI